MKILPAITVATALLASCRSTPQPEMTAAGFIDRATSANIIVLNETYGETPRRLSFTIDDDTRFDGGDIVEGNIAEVTYRPAVDGQPAVATSVTADTTYPEVLGQWKTPENAKLPVTIELRACGELHQIRPADVLTFARWQLEGSDNSIIIFGTVRLPDGQTPCEFATKAELSNVDGRKILTLKPDKGGETKLYFVE